MALHCIGGFIAAMLYRLPRPTVDVDFLSAVPADDVALLLSAAGPGSDLHNKHAVYVQDVAVATAKTIWTDWRRYFLPLTGSFRCSDSIR